MKIKILGIIFLFINLTAQAETNEPSNLPSVSRRVIICDAWQWIGGGATTWGCLKVPREVNVAHGQTTDQLIFSLQDQINKLEDRVKQLESR